MEYQRRFRFIRDALIGSGGFLPAGQQTYLVKYPRETDDKFKSRNEISWYCNDLASACERFAGYMSSNPPTREYGHELYRVMGDDIDGQGNSLDVFMQDLAVNAKARGSMFLLVDMPADLPGNQGDQRSMRAVPVFRPINPESVTSYEIGTDGKLSSIEFSGQHVSASGVITDVKWYFDKSSWKATASGGEIESETHPLGECPVLIFTESGQFPCFGQFSQIADISKRLFNAHSELDEILRSQTFSILRYHVPPEQAHLFNASDVAETIGTHNMLIHYGDSPGFEAPPDGPAMVYMERIRAMEEKIRSIALDVETPNAQESGIALQMRFQALNSALSKFSGRMEDLERRAWELARKWLGLSVAPITQWKRNYMLADVATELTILQQMQASAMPDLVCKHQMRRIVSVQFVGLDQQDLEEINSVIDESTAEIQPGAA